MAKQVTESTKGSSEKQSKFGFNPKDWPLGSKVKYTGERVSEHKGMTGEIVGYRPANGLWVKFPNGKGSISVKQAELVTRAASRKAPAKAAGKAQVTETEPKAGETSQSA